MVLLLALLSILSGGISAQRGCRPPSGEAPNCSGEERNAWYWHKQWSLCLSTRTRCSPDERPDHFDSLRGCTARCRPADGTDCPGPQAGLTPATPDERCSVADNSGCGNGTICVGSFFYSCCPEAQMSAVRSLFQDTCPNGQAAEADLRGEDCDQLICSEGFQCVRSDPFFVRCCRVKEEIAHREASASESDESDDGGKSKEKSEEREEDAGRRLSLARLAGLLRLRHRQASAPMVRGCADASFQCPAWAENFAGEVVRVWGWGLRRLHLDACDCVGFLRAVCPRACGLCQPLPADLASFHFFPFPHFSAILRRLSRN